MKTLFAGLMVLGLSLPGTAWAGIEGPGAALAGALAGEAVGGAAGFGVTLALTPCEGTEGCWPAAAFLVGVPGGAGIGGAVGATLMHGGPGGGRHTARVAATTGATGLLGAGLIGSSLVLGEPAPLLIGAPVSMIGVPVVATLAGLDGGGDGRRMRLRPMTGPRTGFVLSGTW